MRLNVLNRKIHYWTAAAFSIPLLIIISAGVVLQLKKHSAWVQPPEVRGTGKAPQIELSTIIEVLKARPDLQVEGWHHVKRMDVRPDRGVAKVWLHTDYEAQINLGTGEIMQVAYRRSDWIESIHDGSIFGDTIKLYVFFPAAVALLLLWLGGMWMWLWPFLNRRRVRQAKAARP